MKKKIMIGVSILVFLLALTGTLYPVISDYWNTRHQSEVQVEYEKQMESMEDSELTAALEAANAYVDDYHVEIGMNLFHICEFAERMEQAGSKGLIPLRASLPDKCCSTLLETGKVVILKKGDTGYYTTDIPFTTREEAQRIVDEQNSRLGVTKAQEAAMKAGSMFGFAVPAADPKNYDENGIPLGRRAQNHER